MNDCAGTPPPEYRLEDWVNAFSIHVGTAYACDNCHNLVMVTKGGVGVLELSCCGKPMQRLQPPDCGKGDDSAH